MRSNLFYREVESIQKILPVYFRTWWLDFAHGKDNWKYIITKNADGFIIGLLPISVKQKMGVKIISPNHYTHYNGPFIIYDKDRKPDSHISYENEVIGRLLNQIPEVSFIYFQLFPHIHSHLVFFWRRFSSSFTYTYVIDLSNHIDALSEKHKPSVRNHIRKGKVLGYSFEKTNDIGLFTKIFKTSFNYRNKKLPYDLDVLNHLIRTAMDQNCGQIFLVKSSDGQALSGVFCLHDHERAYFVCGTNIMDQNKAGALIFCVWNTICHYKEQGLKTFDFEGSDIKPIEHFFRSFGGNLTPIYRVFWAKNIFIRLLAYFQNSKLFG